MEAELQVIDAGAGAVGSDRGTEGADADAVAEQYAEREAQFEV